MTIDENEGYISVDVQRTDGSKTEAVRIDLFAATNAYAAIHNQFADLNERADEWVEWLKNQGLPQLSHGSALAFAGQIREMVADFTKKKPGLTWETPGSPDSMDSPPAT